MRSVVRGLFGLLALTSLFTTLLPEPSAQVAQPASINSTLEMSAQCCVEEPEGAHCCALETEAQPTQEAQPTAVLAPCPMAAACCRPASAPASVPLVATLSSKLEVLRGTAQAGSEAAAAPSSLFALQASIDRPLGPVVGRSEVSPLSHEELSSLAGRGPPVA